VNHTQKTSPLVDALHIFVLCSFAVAQPLFEQLSRKRVYLEDEGIGGLALAATSVILLVVIPLLFTAAEVVAARIGEVARVRTHLAIVLVLTFSMLSPALKLAKFVPGLISVPLALALAWLAALAYRRSSMVRSFVSFGAPALVAFPLMFFCLSPIFGYLFPKPVPPSQLVAIGNPVPIVFVVLDEFCGMSLVNERREIDAIRYPHFAELAATATWYRNATSVHMRTDRAVPSLLSGVYPLKEGEATIADYPRNLFTLIHATERYEMTVFEPYTRLFPPEADLRESPRVDLATQMVSLAGTLPLVFVRHVFPTDLPFDLPSVPREWYRIQRQREDELDKNTGLFRPSWGQDRDEQFAHFVRLLSPSTKPRLYFSHLVAPHFPWCYLPSGRSYARDRGLDPTPRGAYGDLAETWGVDELAVQHAQQRYLLQVGYVDHLIGKLMDKLKEIDLFDSCLLIVVGDHGVSFQPGQSRRAPDPATVGDIASVPLFIKLPQQRNGTTSDRNVESIDVMPTIIDVLDVTVPCPMDGTSLLEDSLPERPRKTIYGESGPVFLTAEFAEKYESLQRMLSLFGSGESPSQAWDRVFKVGPHAELIGSPLEELAIAEPATLALRFIRLRRDPRDKSPEPIQCFFQGVVRPGPDVHFPVHLALAVNGTIQAVTRTYTERGLRETWSAIVPERFLQPGENDVRVFVVSEQNGKPTLHPVAIPD
jgi:hypothetical protein